MAATLTIDTCTLINLAAGLYPDHNEILDKLEMLVNENKVTLVLPEIVLDEWERHKEEKVIKRVNNSLIGKFRNFKEMQEFLSEQDGEQLTQIIASVTQKMDYFIEAGKQRVERIENLFKYPETKVIPIIDEVRIKAVSLALEQKKPFAPKKNSMADALIFLSVIEYMRGLKAPLYFISDNKEDFGAKNQSELHDDLKKCVEEVSVARKGNEIKLQFNYFINIVTALNSIETNIISKEIERRVQEAQERPPVEFLNGRVGPVVCGVCKTQLSNRVNGTWKPSISGGGLSWWYICHNCGASYDTGDFYD